MFEDWFVLFLDVFEKPIIILEDGEPIFWEGLLGEVVVFCLVLLLSEQISDLLEIHISELVLSGNDIVYLVEERGESGSELGFHSF